MKELEDNKMKELEDLTKQCRLPFDSKKRDSSPGDMSFENPDENLSFLEGETNLANISLKSVSKLAEKTGLLEKENKHHHDELVNSKSGNNKHHKSQNGWLALLGDENNKLKNENNHLQSRRKDFLLEVNML